MSEPRNSLLHTLWSISQAISDASQAGQVGQALMAFAAETGVDVARLVLFSEWREGQPTCVEMRDGWTIDQRPAQPFGTRLPMDSYPLFPFMRSDQPIVSEDIAADPRATEPVRQLMAMSNVASFAIVPLRVRERWLGALFLGRNTPSTYSEELISVAWTLAGQAGGALQHLQAEQAASESEARHRTLLSSIQSPVLALGDDMTIQYCNEAFAAFVGRDPADLAGRNLIDEFPSFSQTASYAAYQLVLATGEMAETEGPMGQSHVRARVYRTPQGIVSIAEDVTERRRAQEEQERLLTETAALYRATRLITAAADVEQVLRGILEYTDLLAVDRCLVALLENPGGEPAERQAVVRAVWDRQGRESAFLGNRFTSEHIPLVGKLDAQGCVVIEDFETATNMDERTRATFRYLGVGAAAIVPLAAGGRLLGWLLAETVGRPRAFAAREVDTLESVAAQAAVALQNLQRLQAIVRQEAEHRALIDNLPDSIYFKDLECRFIRVNPHQASVLGIDDPQSAMGKTDLDFFQPDVAQQSMADEKRVLETGQPLIGRVEKIVHRQPEGRQDRWFSATKLPMLDDEGRVIGLVGISHDITELKAAQDAAQRHAAALALAAEISQAATSVLDPDELVRQAVELIRERFELYYVGLFLVEDAPGKSQEPSAVLRAGTGEAGQQMLAQGHRLAIGSQSMIGWCIAHGRPRVALDVGDEAVRFDNPLLPETRSELALPLMSRGQAIGALTIQSEQEAVFASETITALQTMADQLGNAIGNARLFRERERRLAELAVVNDIGRALSSALEIGELLEMVYEQVGRLFDTTNFYIATYDEGSPEWFSALHVEGGERQPPRWYSLEAGLTGYILRSGMPLLFGTREENLAFEREQGLQILGNVARSWLAVPLIAAEKRVGVMCIQNYEHDYLYDEHDLALFTTVAGQVAVTLDNMRLLAAARRRAQQQEAVNEVGRTITSVLDLSAVLDEIVDITKQHFGGYFVSLLLMEHDRLVFQAGSTIGNSAIRLEPGAVVIDLSSGQGLTAQAFRSGQPVLVDDVSQDPRYVALPELASTRSELDVPIRAKGQVIGVLSMQADRTHAYDDTTAALLQSLADQAGAAIENARLFRESSQRTSEMQALYSIALRLGTRMDTPELLRVIVEQSLALLDAETGAFYLYDPQTQELVLEVAVGYFHSWIGARLKPGVGLAGRVFQQRQPEIVADYHGWAERAAAYEDEKRLHGLLAVPVLSGDRVLGVLDIAAGPQKPLLDEHDVWLAQSFAALAATALDSARLFEQTQTAAANTERLYQASRLALAAQNVDDILAAILVYTRPLDLDRCLLAMLEDPAATPANRLAQVRAVWDRGGREADFLGNRFGAKLIPALQALGPADRLVVEDWSAELPPGVDGQTAATFRHLGVGAAAIVPLAIGGRLLGWLLAETTGRPQRFAERDLNGLQSVAGQAAVALDNLRLLEEASRRAQELQALNEVGQAVTSVLDLDTVLMHIVDITKQRFGHYFVGIALVEGDQIIYRSGSTIGDSEHRLEATRVDVKLTGSRGLIAEVATTGRPLLVDDVLSDPRYIALPELGATRAELDVPIVTKGRVTGVLSVQADRPFVDEERTISLLQALADQAGVAIENARLFTAAQHAELEQRRRSEELAALQQISIELALEQRDLASVLETISSRAMSLLDSDGGGVWLWRENDQELELVLDHQVDGVHFAGSRLKPGEGLCGRALSERAIQIIDDYLAWNGHADGFADAPFSSAMAAPMIWQNQVIGVLVVTRSRPGHAYSGADRSLAELLAAQATAFIQNARLFEQAQLRAQELVVLNEMAHSLGQMLSIAGVLTAIHEHASRLMDTTNFFVALYDAEQELIHFPLYAEGTERRRVASRPRGTGLTEHVMDLGRPLLIQDNLEAYEAAAGVAGVGTPAQSWLGVPLVVANQTIGIVCVQSYTTPGLYDEHDRDLLSAIAGQAAIALETARLFEQQQHTAGLLADRVRQLDCLSDIGRKVQEQPPLPEFLEWAAGRLPEAMGHPAICRVAVDFGGQLYGEPAAVHLPQQMVHSLQVGPEIAGHVYVSYTEEQPFLDEESALLGEVVRRIGGYVESQGLLEETRQAARRLAEERTLLRTVIDAVPDLIYVKDRDSRFMISNLAHLRTLGAASQAEAQGRTDFDCFPAEQAEAFFADERKVIEDDQPLLDREESYTDPQGNKTWLQTTKVPLHDSQGRVTGLVGIGRNITERKKMEDQLARERDLLQALMDLSPDYIFFKDRASRFVRTNRAHAQALGLAGPGDAIGKTDFDLFPAAEATRNYDEEQQIMASGRPVLGREWLITSAQGASWMSEHKLPVIEPTGEASGLIGIARDITARVQSEANIKRRGAQLQCLSDIGQRIGEAPAVPDFMAWVAQRIPAAMQHSDVCVAAIELESEVYGVPEAFDLPCQMVQRLGSGAGRAAIAYREENEFLNEESALLGEIVRRIDGYLDNRRLFDQVEAAYAEARTLYDASRRLASATDLQDVVAAVVEVVPMPAVDRAIVWELQHDDAGEPVAVASIANWHRSPGRPPLPVGVRFALDQFAAIRLALSAESILIEDTELDARLDDATRALFVRQQARACALLPMWLAGRQTALLMLVSAEPHRFAEAELRPYVSLLGQMAVSIENRRLLEETRASLARTEALYAASSLANVLDDVQEMLQAIANGVATALPADRVLLAVLDQAERRVTHHAWAGPGSATLELAPYDELWTGLSGWVLREGKPAVSPKGTIDPRESPEAQRRRVETQSGSIVVVPLLYRGEVLGTLSAVNRIDQPDFSRGLELMVTMANQAAAVVRSAQLFEQTQQTLAETEVLYRASSALSAAGSYEDLLATLRAHTLLAQADRSLTLELFDQPWTEEYVPEWANVVARYTQLQTELHSPRFALRGRPVVNVLRPDRPLIVEDVHSDARLDAETIAFYSEHFGAQSGLIIPLVAGGQWIGHIEALFGAATQFPSAQIQQIMILAGQAAVALQNLRQFEQVQAALAEVEATHRRYLQGRWQAYLQQREVLLQSGYLYDQAQATRPEAMHVQAVPDLWRPELADALRTAAPAQSRLHSAAGPAGIAPAGGGPLDSPQERLQVGGESESVHGRHEAPGTIGEQRTGLAVPITLRGQTIGVLGIEDPVAGRQWSDAEVEVLQEVSQQLALALENARLFEETQRRAERERLITEITARIRSSTDMLGVLETTATELGKALGTSRAVVRLTVKEENQEKAR